jgi:hypothetical protein
MAPTSIPSLNHIIHPANHVGMINIGTQSIYIEREERREHHGAVMKAPHVGIWLSTPSSLSDFGVLNGGWRAAYDTMGASSFDFLIFFVINRVRPREIMAI